MKILSSLFFILFSSIVSGNYKTDTLLIHSAILNETRTVLIFTPEDMQTGKPVSLIYMLDGEFAGDRFQKIIESASNHQIIGLGIINTNRNRDLLPVREPGKFLEFIETELMPRFEDGHLLKERILYGHSFAGGFTLYAMINRPGLFQKYIASSPTPIMKMTEPSIYKELDSKLPSPVQLYFSWGSDDMGQVIKWTEMLKNNLSTLSLKNIIWRNEIFQGENHNTSDKISIVNGLL